MSKKIKMEIVGDVSRWDTNCACVCVSGGAELTEAGAFGGMDSTDILDAVVDAGFCEAFDAECQDILREAVLKACYTSGLSFASLDFGSVSPW